MRFVFLCEKLLLVISFTMSKRSDKTFDDDFLRNQEVNQEAQERLP